ncbi:hypothetical protein GTP58_20185 [Duganella sp. CY15W]|uniref:hypothetical protein n=1 Tax=Duganella sp. CY15W TaxID=2692172 RepID=UPI00136E60A6|nr:hypothetical protein [Duganella sp. CY15W]MYM30655.1 hypothetical protein [Duganella sp. CY15W]
MSARIKIFSVICVAGILAACTTPHTNEGVENLIANNVVRMTVNWDEKDSKAWSPASYSVMGNYFHWSENSIQYRWIPVQANLRRDLYGQANNPARIPDGFPILSSGDLVDVYVPPWSSMNYGELKAPIIVRFVCSASDSACQDLSKKDLGGRNEVVSKGKPDMGNLVFTKKFDESGNRLKQRQ